MSLDAEVEEALFVGLQMIAFKIYYYYYYNHHHHYHPLYA
jgi:hypothetical protein